MTVDSARPQLHNLAAQIPVFSMEGAAPVVLKKEGEKRKRPFLASRFALQPPLNMFLKFTLDLPLRVLDAAHQEKGDRLIYLHAPVAHGSPGDSRLLSGTAGPQAGKGLNSSMH
jgi:hypothetical protein